MAGIYTRDNINYSSMLQNAIANRAKAAEREAAYIQNQGKLWGDTATNVGKYFGRGYMAYQDSLDEDEAELAQLKAQKAYEEQVEQRKKFDEYFNNPDNRAERLDYIQEQYDNYADYKPNGTYNPMPAEPRKIQYIGPKPDEPWDGYSDVDLEDNLYRKALNRGVYA
jgi:hypothetical protein